MKALLLFLLFFTFLQAEEDFIVRVATESTLTPLYMHPIESKKANFSADYLEKLNKILCFDFNYNGLTQIVEKQNLARYIASPLVEGSSFTLKLEILSTRSVKKAGPVTLKGNLAEDRRILHQVADTLYQNLTQKKGVASTKILYTVATTKNKKKTAEVWECDWDGGNQRQITHDGALAVTPCYLPYSKGSLPSSSFYVSYQMGQPKIYFSSLEYPTKASRLTPIRGNQLMPSINKQGNLVAFVCDVQGNPDLFVQPFDLEKGPIGKPRQVYATMQGTQGSPTFSPNGKEIAFVSNKDGAPRIYVMDLPKEGAKAKELKPKLITKRSKENTSPSWSQDGNYLAYSAMTHGVRQIWIYDFNKKEERQITSGSQHKENPCFAPDSLHIVYNTSDSQDDSIGELYLTHIEQKQSIKISSGAGQKRFAHWQLQN